MSNKNRHVSHHDLVLAAEGELPQNRREQVQKHISTCGECRARMEAIQSTISDLVQLRYQQNVEFDAHIPSVDVSRARLEAKLAEAATKSRISLWPNILRIAFSAQGARYVTAALLVSALAIWLGRLHHAQNIPDRSDAQPESSPIPNRKLTPGAVRPVSLKEICMDPPQKEDRAVPTSEQQLVFQEYGMASARPENYELDYLITPELGGSDDIRNLWPEPHSSTVWNSYVKDDLENHLHQLVCTGKINLATAQHDIATDWIFAYKKYFQTDRPISNRS